MWKSHALAFLNHLDTTTGVSVDIHADIVDVEIFQWNSRVSSLIEVPALADKKA